MSDIERDERGFEFRPSTWAADGQMSPGQTTAPLAPENCDPDTWYEITHYMERVVAKRDNEDPKYPWRISISHRCSDRVVKDPVPLVPGPVPGQYVIPDTYLGAEGDLPPGVRADRERADRRIAEMERERDDAVARAEQSEMLANQRAEMVRRAKRERDEWKEVAESKRRILWEAESKVRLLEGERAAQPSPAVTRADVEFALGELDAEGDDDDLTISLAAAIEAVCDLLGIESAVDPVEDLATRFKAAARDALRTTVDAMTAIAPALAAFDFDELLDDISPEQWRTMARNALGREAGQ